MDNSKFKQIRYSNDNDLRELLRWLSEQDRDGVEDTFHCNKNLTIESHEDGQLIVFIDPSSNIPVGYQWGGLLQSGITEVHKDYRGKGIGRALVNYRIQEAIKKDEPILKIECTPRTSIPFWEYMGFTIYGPVGKLAYMLLEKELPHPQKGCACRVEFSFFDESKKYDSSVPYNENHSIEALKTPQGVIHLPKRVVYFHTKHMGDDPVISITVDDENIFLDKAKYNKAESLGVIAEGKVVYIDQIHIKNL